MVTKLIGVKDFRQNLASYHQRAVKNKWRYIVLNRNKPMFEVRPLSHKEMVLEQLAKDVAEARKSIAEGRTYSSKEVRSLLGL